ncbi:MAG: helix-turn-helix transcriptional regulator [Saprospiraceae bacterium]
MKDWELQNQIKVQRAINNLTQEELAVKIGVTRKTINTIENGKFVPSTILAIRLSRIFNIKVEDLFNLIDKY